EARNLRGQLGLLEAWSVFDLDPRRGVQNRKTGIRECVGNKYARHQPFLLAKSFMKSTSVCTHVTLTALYIETRIPPTLRCPLRPTMPAFFADDTKFSSSASLGRRNTTFMTERLSFATGQR